MPCRIWMPVVHSPTSARVNLGASTDEIEPSYHATVRETPMMFEFGFAPVV